METFEAICCSRPPGLEYIRRVTEPLPPDKTTPYHLPLPRALVLVGLVTLGVFVGGLRLPLFFDVDFLFASVFTLLILYLYGPAVGAFSGFVIASFVLVAYGRFLTFALLVGEAFFMARVYDPRRQNLVIADIFYWNVIGIPVVVVSRLLSGDGEIIDVLLSAVRPAVNGIVNAVAAGLITNLLQLSRRASEFFSLSGRLSFQRTIFNLIIMFVLLPAMVSTVVFARMEIQRVEEDIQDRVTFGSAAASESLTRWIDENVRTLSGLAEITAERIARGEWRTVSQMHAELMFALRTDDDLQFVAIYDERGRVVTAVVGEPRVADLVSAVPDLGQFASLDAASRFALSDLCSVSPGNGPTEDGAVPIEPPVVSVLLVPVVVDSVHIATIGAGLEIERLNDVLSSLGDHDATWITLLDGRGHVVLSNEPDVTVGRSYASLHGSSGLLRSSADDGTYLRVPKTAGGALAYDRMRRTIFGRQAHPFPASGWSLHVLTNLDGYTDRLNLRFFITLSAALLSALLAVGVAAPLSRRLVDGIGRLSDATGNLPERIAGGRQVAWPSTHIEEIAELIENFRSTSNVVTRGFEELTAANEELRTARKRAEAANEAKSRFIANISHDLRTPLNGILGYAQLLRQDGTLTEEQVESVRIIQRSGSHLLSLITDILDLSKIEADRMVLYQQPTDLPALLTDVAAIAEIPAKAKGLLLESSAEGDLSELVLADPKRLRQILLNLLTNAVKFTRVGRVVLTARVVSAGDTRTVVAFSVSDTGRGIPPDSQEDIFSPFRQLDRHVQTEEGTGLGLAIVGRLTGLMGGEVAVDSRVGHGSTFTVTIPFPIATESDRIDHRAAPIDDTGSDGHPVIAILGRDEPLRDRLAESFRMLGYAPRTSTDRLRDATAPGAPPVSLNAVWATEASGPAGSTAGESHRSTGGVVPEQPEAIVFVVGKDDLPQISGLMRSLESADLPPMYVIGPDEEEDTEAEGHRLDRGAYFGRTVDAAVIANTIDRRLRGVDELEEAGDIAVPRAVADILWPLVRSGDIAGLRRTLAGPGFLAGQAGECIRRMVDDFRLKELEEYLRRYIGERRRDERS